MSKFQDAKFAAFTYDFKFYLWLRLHLRVTHLNIPSSSPAMFFYCFSIDVASLLITFTFPISYIGWKSFFLKLENKTQQSHSLIHI